MNNCLTTQLKALVNNDNLPILGYLSVPFATSSSSSSDNRFNVAFTAESVVKSTVPFYLTSDLSGDSYMEYTFPYKNAEYALYFQPNKTGVIHFEMNKLLTLFEPSIMTIVSLNSDKLRYCTSLNKIFLTGSLSELSYFDTNDLDGYIQIRMTASKCYWKGSLSSIAQNNQLITEFRVLNSEKVGLTGELKDLSPCLELTTLNFSPAVSSLVYGELKEYVEQRTAQSGYVASLNGSTKTLGMTLRNTLVTFDGNASIMNDGTWSLVFSTTQVTVSQNNVLKGTYNISSGVWS